MCDEIIFWTHISVTFFWRAWYSCRGSLSRPGFEMVRSGLKPRPNGGFGKCAFSDRLLYTGILSYKQLWFKLNRIVVECGQNADKLLFPELLIDNSTSPTILSEDPVSPYGRVSLGYLFRWPIARNARISGLFLKVEPLCREAHWWQVGWLSLSPQMSGYNKPENYGYGNNVVSISSLQKKSSSNLWGSYARGKVPFVTSSIKAPSI
jgi:hypothetical protein